MGLRRGSLRRSGPRPLRSIRDSPCRTPLFQLPRFLSPPAGVPRLGSAIPHQDDAASRRLQLHVDRFGPGESSRPAGCPERINRSTLGGVRNSPPPPTCWIRPVPRSRFRNLPPPHLPVGPGRSTVPETHPIHSTGPGTRQPGFESFTSTQGPAEASRPTYRHANQRGSSPVAWRPREAATGSFDSVRRRGPSDGQQV